MQTNTDGVTEMLDKNKVFRARMLTYGLSTGGMVAGIVTGVKRKSGFWGTVGWAVLGSIGGGAIASVINSAQGNYINN